MKKETTVRLCERIFKKKCPERWENLVTTEDPSVKHCKSCQREVFLCESDEETMAHAEQGHCIARSAPVWSELPMLVLGEPDAEWLRANQPTPQQEAAQADFHRELNINSALDNIKLTTRRCTNCGYPMPRWWDDCRVCGGQEFREK